MQLKLFQYTSTLFLKAIFGVTIVFAASFFIIDFIELIIRTHNTQVPIFTTIKITLAHIPFMIQETSLLILFAALIYTFIMLAKRNEYTAIKASGVSLRNFLLPFVTVSFIFSTFIIIVINPISSHLLQYRTHLKKITNQHTSEPLALSKYGILLLDMPKHNKEELYIISAEQLHEVSSKEIYLYKTSYIITSSNYIFKKRIDAEKATLRKNEWILTKAIEKRPKEHSKKYQEITLHSSLRPQDLINSFRKPKQISIWTLPKFIKTLKIIGGSTDQYVQYFLKLIIKPFLTIGLVCIAASFSLKPSRNRKNQHIIAYGTCLGFLSFIYIEFIMKLHISHSIPYINSVITVTSFTLIGLIALYYSEKKYMF